MNIQFFKRLIFLSLYPLFSLIITSCCTKEKCLGPRQELQFKVNLSGDYSYLKVFVRTDRGVSLIESYGIMGEKFFSTSFDFDYLSPEPYSYTILFRLDDEIVDSLTNFRFEKVKGKIDCGTCFPLGRGSMEVQKIQNLSFTHNDKSLGIQDTVLIGF